MTDKKDKKEEKEEKEEPVADPTDNPSVEPENLDNLPPVEPEPEVSMVDAFADNDMETFKKLVHKKVVDLVRKEISA